MSWMEPTPEDRLNEKDSNVILIINIVKWVLLSVYAIVILMLLNNVPSYNKVSIDSYSPAIILLVQALLIYVFTKAVVSIILNIALTRQATEKMAGIGAKKETSEKN